MNVCYLGPCYDYSGYGEANRHFIAALNTVGVNVIVRPVRYTKEQSDFGNIGALCEKLSRNTDSYKIKIIHVTPDQYPMYIEQGKYNIGHLFWETSLIPKAWVKECNKLQEIWTGSKTNADAIRNAGVTVPIWVCPQPIETDRDNQKPYKILDEAPGRFYFYSIFEWTERKNPTALLKAYFEEFSEDDNVGLIIKTYLGNFNNEQTALIQSSIAAIKAKYVGKQTAPLFVYKYLMDRFQVQRIHATGNCYVTTHRGEGWGIPVVEAMLQGNPVISTAYNGINEYLMKDGKGITVPCTMIPVRNSRNHEWYTQDQKWAEIDLEALKKEMRRMYTDQQAAKKIGEECREYVVNNFNFHTVGKQMSDRLAIIERKL